MRALTLLMFQLVPVIVAIVTLGTPAGAQVGRADRELGVLDARAQMQALAPLVGSFDLTASETATDDSRFDERGTRHCRWAAAETVILCEDARMLVAAAGRYEQLPANRRSLRMYRWNAGAATFEQVDTGTTGTPQVRTLAFDTARRTLSYQSVVQSRGETLDNHSVFTMGADRHLLSQALRSRTSSLQEEYRETAVRRIEAAERVVFSSDRGGNTDLYLANADGTALRRLTTDPAADLIPRCSPDGRQVVFLRGAFSEIGELYLLDLVTGVERRLTNDAVRDSTPQWSADGRRIYFTRRAQKSDRLAVMDLDTLEISFLTDEAGWHDTMPGVSPDGRTLVHHTYRYGRETELHLLDVVTRRSQRLTDAPGFDYEASFAGHDHVIFSSNRAGGYYRLYVASLTDGAVRLLADTGADAWGSRYSARSNSVVFHTGPRSAWRLMRVDFAGGRAVPLFDDGFSNASGDWCAAQ